MFITKKHIARRTVLKAAGVKLALPFLEAMVPAATALAQTAAVPKMRAALLLPSPRRHHVQHVARPCDGQVDAQRFRRRFQAQPDPGIARAVQEIRDVVRQPGERRHRGLGAYVQSRDVAQRHASGHRRSQGAHGHDARSGDREVHQPGHPAALSRSGLGNHRSSGGGRRRLLYNSVFPGRRIAAAHGIQSAESLFATLRRRRHAAGTRGNQPSDQTACSI